MKRQSPRRHPVRALLAIGLITASVTAAHAEDLSKMSGAQLFRQFCGACHGRNADGDGPVAPFFKLSPPDLTLLARRNGGNFPDERVRRIVDGRTILMPHGARAMPVWGVEFAMDAPDAKAGAAAAEQTITRLVEYLRTVQKPAAAQ